jgi:hypothetical protein
LTPTAHAGHWLTGLLYLAPVAIVMIVLAWQGRKERRGEGEQDIEP